MSVNKTIAPKDKKIIALTGMMGSGKSTVGIRLAKKLNISFIDSDKEIEKREKKNINDIFKDESIEYFRKIEEEVISDIISKNDPTILSLGGGALISEKTRTIINDNTVSVWLNASVEVLLQRVGDKTNRPLLNNVDKREVLTKLIEERSPIYEKCDLRIDSNNTSHEQTVQKILQELQKIIE
jgi:shikimate kinase